MMILRFGILVEHAGQHHADRLRRGLDREAPGGADHHRKILDVVLVVGVHHRRMRYRRMQIDRHIELLGALEDRPEPLVVEEQAAVRVPWIMAPLKPCLSTVRSSSSAAATGSKVGSAAKAAKRSGFGAHDRGEPVVDARGRSRPRHRPVTLLREGAP